MALITCPECKRSGVSDSGTCPGCGANLANRCRKCGSVNTTIGSHTQIRSLMGHRIDDLDRQLDYKRYLYCKDCGGNWEV